MTTAPTQMVFANQEERKQTATPEWVRDVAMAALVAVLLVLLAHWMIADRRYGPGRR